jgi:hypothetical protein
MKKTTLIIIGIVAVVLLFAIWLYLLIYGTPTKVTEYFTDFSLFGGNTPATITPAPTATDTAPVTVDVKKDALRQLTTRPVIGFAEFTPTGTTTFMRYAEAGTGHIYQINLDSGEETRLSNVTVPNAELAAFSPDGKYVAIRSGFGANNEIILVTLVPNAEATAESLAPKMADFAWSNQNEIRYTEVTGYGLAGRILNPDTKTIRDSFTVPFQSATVIWSLGSTSQTYVYPKASTQLQGYLYSIKNGGIFREPLSGYGLIADANSRYVIETVRENTTPKSYQYRLVDGVRSALPIVIEPSKCVFSGMDPNLVYCGSQLDTTYSEQYPDDWYKGIHSFSDDIWTINLQNHQMTQLVNPLKTVGRDIDMTFMTISANAKMLYFINKNDNVLWSYEISTPTIDKSAITTSPSL